VTIDEVMRSARVIPVLVLEGEGNWKALAETLVGAGLPVLEVTLRTPVALEAIGEMARVPGAVVGAGTVLSPAQLDAAMGCGARFIVSPGLTEPLAREAVARQIPFLPGVATASDIMRGLDLGLDRFKFFPAEASGGVAALKALSAPFADVRFCPTGGITSENAPEWLALPSVLCVGGSWIVKPGESNPAAIAERARAAASL
jgi:2-dehydro-3-deoxyphosphogluconate aldolase/(4S)-4-hydroxy-2-oxoglutarate aldolase